MTIGDDGLGEAVQPACPTCGTVLHTLRRGFECRGCGQVFIDSMPGGAGWGSTAGNASPPGEPSGDDT